MIWWKLRQLKSRNDQTRRRAYYECREGTVWFSETRNAQPWTMDCSQVRKLARRELTRRGLVV